MAERRPRSLLEFAIAASAAVVPVMVAMLVLVAVVRPSDAPGDARGVAADRYVSARHVAALRTFESAIVERGAPSAEAPTAQRVLDGVPACAKPWGVGWRDAWLARWRGQPAVPAAEHVAESLARLDAVLARGGAAHEPRALDVARWLDAAQAIVGTDVESDEYPGHRFRMRCSDLEAALAALTRADGRMLDAFAWREHTPPGIVAGWDADRQVAITARDLTRRNPWSGVAGCIYLTHLDGARIAPVAYVAGERSLQRQLCARVELTGPRGADRDPVAIGGEPGADDALDDPRWGVPPSLATLLQPLDGARQPASDLHAALANARRGDPKAPANRIVIDGAPVDVGDSIDLTIDPSAQALAQKVAACYTGRADACRALAIHRAEDGDRTPGGPMLEGAMVRMAAVAIVDVATGRIEALAGARSRCARLDAEGRPRDARCDARVPRGGRPAPDALLNPAVYHDAMPASTIKPILATAFLTDPDVGARWLADERSGLARGGEPARDSLRGQLMRSDSARFLDRMFCHDKHYAACDRPWLAQRTAASFGWNADCALARLDCGREDLLFGRAVDAPPWRGGVAPPATRIAYGRLMTEPVSTPLGPAMRLRPPASFDVAKIARCAVGRDGKRGTDDDWGRCKGGALVDVVAEGWGQGHARATALGVAGMLATLASAANGDEVVHRPHLVERVHGTNGTLEPATARWPEAGSTPSPVPREVAETILGGLAYSHRAGTARTACEQVFDARRCRDLDWLAGKTGTPSFPGDGMTLDAVQRACTSQAPANSRNAQRRAGTHAHANAAHADPDPQVRAGLCSLKPYKWYVGTYRTSGQGTGPWNKVIAVLTERNWVQRTGQIHGVGDHGPNPSAEIAMQIAGRQVGVLPEAPTKEARRDGSPTS